MPELDILPVDAATACLVGRVWRPELDGPSVVTIRDGAVFDICDAVCTMRDLCETEDPAGLVSGTDGCFIGTLEDIVARSHEVGQDLSGPLLLAPIDLQAVKALGVTFIASLLERVIEERAGGDPLKATIFRADIETLLGNDLARLQPGSAEADLLKERLVEHGLWSQYLEVGIGPDPEVFTKAQPLSCVGYGANIGILSTSSWNNPEPEVALAVSSCGRPVGATLANDVNLRDYEGRSALLLGKAKDNNASCAVGPFLRLFDNGFDLDDVRNIEIELKVNGEDGFELSGSSSLMQISRDPSALITHVIGPNNQYPDGLLLLLGTMFAPTQDRDEPGKGFTHTPGDKVRIYTEKLGCLSNVVRYCHECPPWTVGVAYLMRNLFLRGLF
jgi:fumarylacetoacetate (FAA) hydrolase family protein